MLLNTKSTAFFNFEIGSIDSTDLEDVLQTLYGSRWSTKKLRNPRQSIAGAFEQWFFRFITDNDQHGTTNDKALHFYAPVRRREFADGLTANLLTEVSPRTAAQVFSDAEDIDESEFVEFALVCESQILLIHLGTSPRTMRRIQSAD